jgi:peptidoglycan hydrolase CwlO-like protein
MAKNDKAQLSVDDIEQRKKDLNTELESVQAQIQKMDSMRVQLTAQGNAINGAIQQCDAFLQQLGESSPDSSIPSQETNPAINAVMS